VRARLLPLALLVALPLAGCLDTTRYDQAVCVLIDVSGTYADQRPEAVRILKRDVLPGMEPGDTLVVLRIDSESYEKSNLEALVTLDARPSRANAQKLALAQKLDAFAVADARSEYTDIPGAMMLGTEYLREIDARSRVMLVFSDLREDLPRGTTRTLAPSEFQGIQVVAINVKRLASDNADPDFFRGRLAGWERRLTDAGAMGWKTLMDPAKLGPTLAELRS
jgi:hypothetical protein